MNKRRRYKAKQRREELRQTQLHASQSSDKQIDANWAAAIKRHAATAHDVTISGITWAPAHGA